MLQRFVAKWLQQQAQDALLQGLRPAESTKTEDAAQLGEPETAAVACFFPAANQAAGLVDLLTDATVTQCHGFVEHLGTVSKRRVAIIEAALPHPALAHVVRDVISLRKPSWVVATGFATATNPTVARGDMMIANRLVDSAGYSLAIDTKMPTSKHLHVGTLLTLDGEPPNPSDTSGGAAVPATALTSTDGTLAHESQAAVIGEVCRVLKTKMMAVHCAATKVGDVESTLAKGIKSQATLAGMVGAAASALIDKPGSIKDLWNDKEARLVFADRLAKFLVSVIAQLP